MTRFKHKSTSANTQNPESAEDPGYKFFYSCLYSEKIFQTKRSFYHSLPSEQKIKTCFLRRKRFMNREKTVHLKVFSEQEKYSSKTAKQYTKTRSKKMPQK